MKIKDVVSRKNINFKVSEYELKLMKKQAKKYAGGNLSAWLKYATTKLAPLKEDLVA